MNLRGRLGRLEQMEGRGPCSTCWEREQRLRHGASDTAEIRRILSIRDSEDSTAADQETPS